MGSHDELLDLAERMWQGERPIDTYREVGRVFEVTPRIALALGFGNVVAIRTNDGLVLADTSQAAHVDPVLRSLREWDISRVNTVFYTHGHFDHAGGMRGVDEEAARRGDPRVRVVAHENVGRRFDRYAETAGYNTVINGRQFRSRAVATEVAARWRELRHPDLTVRDALSLEVGGGRFELHHAKGETDDHLWIEVPSEGAILSGDLFVWVCPNAGNPQKVQRYPREWAQALRAIVAAGPEILIPAHNLPIFGHARIAEALGNAAELLDLLVDQTIALMNEGRTLEEVLAEVKLPEKLTKLHYLAPTYDEPEFIVRNVWRMYGGWYDGNPARLKPAKVADVAFELAALSGGALAMAHRASQLASEGSLKVATELVELAGRAAPDDAEVHRIRAEVYQLRARAETSLMARSIFSEAAEHSAARAG